MRYYRLTRPPNALRRRRVQLDNVALVPASLLPYKSLWQGLANTLPTGSVLIVSPRAKPGTATIARVGEQLKAHGHRVVTLPSERFV